MKFFLLLLSFSVFANEYQLKETGARFTLKISADELFYESESFTKRVSVKNCNRQLAIDLNTELFSKIPQTHTEKGFIVFIDKTKFQLSPESDLAKTFLIMDARIMRFLAEEKKVCQ